MLSLLFLPDFFFFFFSRHGCESRCCCVYSPRASQTILRLTCVVSTESDVPGFGQVQKISFITPDSIMPSLECLLLLCSLCRVYIAFRMQSASVDHQCTCDDPWLLTSLHQTHKYQTSRAACEPACTVSVQVCRPARCFLASHALATVSAAVALNARSDPAKLAGVCSTDCKVDLSRGLLCRIVID